MDGDGDILSARDRPVIRGVLEHLGEDIHTFQGSTNCEILPSRREERGVSLERTWRTLKRQTRLENKLLAQFKRLVEA